MTEAKKMLFWANDMLPLPAGWHLVDYIAGNSSRTAYVNTEVVPTSQTCIEMDVTLEPDASNGWIFATEDYYHNTTSQCAGPCFSVGWNGRLTYGGGYTPYESRGCDFKLGNPVHMTVKNGVMCV